MMRGVLLALLIASPALAQDRPRGPAMAPEFRLRGETVSIPFVMVGEFPFVEAKVNGVKGKLMLDTGSGEALALNHNHLALPEGRDIGQGQFGSGQTFKIVLRPRVESVRLAGGLAYGPVTMVRSQDASLLEGITPDFLGWLGHWFWDGYAVKLDYKAGRATFYKGGPKAFLRGERLVAALPFSLPKLPNHPVISTRIGDAEFQTLFDTGQYGHLYADAPTLERLKSQGELSPVEGEDHPVDIKAVRFQDGPAVAIARLPTSPIEAAAPFAKPIGVEESPRVLSLGYAFLQQYKTVWDYPNKTLYLLAK